MFFLQNIEIVVVWKSFLKEDHVQKVKPEKKTSLNKIVKWGVESILTVLRNSALILYLISMYDYLLFPSLC